MDWNLESDQFQLETEMQHTLYIGPRLSIF